MATVARPQPSSTVSEKTILMRILLGGVAGILMGMLGGALVFHDLAVALAAGAGGAFIGMIGPLAWHEEGELIEQ